MCYIPHMLEFEPLIESGIPVPPPNENTMPDLTDREEVMLRARTVKLLSDLTDQPIKPTAENRLEAREAFNTDADIKPLLPHYPNETLAYLAGMVSEYDRMVVRDLADLKVYVVNKLIEETGGKNAKDRLTALRALGEIDGVDAFKKRTEITINQKSTEEIEKELLEKLNKYAIDVEAVEVQDVEEVEEVEEVEVEEVEVEVEVEEDEETDDA